MMVHTAASNLNQRLSGSTMQTTSTVPPVVSVKVTTKSKVSATAFKENINSSLKLLGQLDDNDKEDIWRFWRTISSAVKIAVCGKGDFLGLSKKSGKCFKHGDGNDMLFSLEQFDSNMITVWVPNNKQSPGCNKNKFRVFKLENNEKIATYFESFALKTDDNELQKSAVKSVVPVLAKTTEPMIVISAPAQTKLNNIITRSSASTRSNIFISSASPQKVQIKGSKATNPLWPICQPVMNTLQNAKPPTTFPLSQEHSNQIKDYKHTGRSNEMISVDVNHMQIADKAKLEIKPEENPKSETNDVNDDRQQRKDEEKDSSSDYIKNKVSLTDFEIKLRSESGQAEKSISAENITTVSTDNPNNDVAVVELVSLNEKNLFQHTPQSMPIIATFPQDTVSLRTEYENPSTPAVPNILIEESHKEKSQQHFPPPEQDQRLQDSNLPGSLAQRNASDIEAIISALEDELKKSGTRIRAISVTSPQCPSESSPLVSETLSPSGNVPDTMQQDSEKTTFKDVKPEGESSVEETTTLPHSAGLNKPNHLSEAHPVEIGYDVVEYEVHAEKQPKRSRRRKTKDGSAKEENLDSTCPICHRVLRYASSMAAHMRIHTGAKPYSCGQCDRQFTTKANRDRHEATHVGLKPFQCSVCSKCFTEKRSLHLHMRTHTGERPFSCRVCGKSFTQNCSLQVHMDRHTNRKGYPCDLCGKAFRQKSQLDIHVKRHNRQAAFPCKECSTKCYTKGDLMRHMIKHTGERPFQCNQCPRAFTRKQYLVDHLNVHKGLKPYKCCECSAAFHDMGSYHRHLRKHKDSKKDTKVKVKEKPKVAAEVHHNPQKTEIGQVIQLQDGSDAVVTAVLCDPDGSTVYHMTYLDNASNKLNDSQSEDTSSDNCLSSKQKELPQS